jgi:uracil-DNA glycosylase
VGGTRLHRAGQAASVRPVIRPVDVVLEFLAAEQARGVTHVHLDEGAREALREVFALAKSGGIPAPATSKEEPATVKNDAPRMEISLEPESKPTSTVPNTSISITGSTRAEQLESLRRQAENWGPAKSLGSLRETMVFATGNPEARVMLVGEAPGYQEEREREPFVGPAGQKLNDILKAMGIFRDEVYISNIVKFRPATPKQTTNNRKPTPEEMAACMPFVKAEIGIVKPECIIALGGTAAEGLLGLEGSVTSMRGKWHDFDGTPVRVTYHPSYLLQSGGSTNVKRQVWEDMLAAMEKLGLPISDKQRGFFLPKA